MARKSWGTSEKVQEARDRKTEGKRVAREAESKAKEDAYWESHANPKAKRDAKREAAERGREEAAARKAETRRLAAAEEAAMAHGTRKTAPKPKMTHHQLTLQKERDQRLARATATESAQAAQREASEDTYAAMVDVENANVRDRDAVDASGLEQALQQLGVSETGPASPDQHPERRAKAAWEAYYDSELPRLKEDKPGLRLMQYKSMIFENWQKSPLNPRNQMTQPQRK